MRSCMGFLKPWIKMKLQHIELLVHKYCKTNRKRCRRLKRLSLLHWLPRVKKRRIQRLSIICFKASGNTTKSYHFDTDSRPIRVDNCATRCISPFIDDFVGPPILAKHQRIKGIIGSTGQVMFGTIRWHIEDDDGVVHELLIPNSIYLKQGTSRLLSPQHWAQEAKDDKPIAKGTWCATYSDKIILYWKQNQYKRTIPLEKDGPNIAMIRTAPGYTRFHAFCADANLNDTHTYCIQSNVISDDESDTASIGSASEEEEIHTRKEPLLTDFNLETTTPQLQDNLPVVIEDEEDRTPSDKSAAFLEWHHRLGHISPVKIKTMASNGILPKYLADCRVPLCTSCLFGKATRRPWRTKPSKMDQTPTRTITKPGECVSVDQLESTTPGLIAQLKHPTKARYRVATVFIDHATRFSYVYLQQSTNAEETVQAKRAFEQFARTNGINIQHYHADNGRFADNKFRKDIAACGQTLSFCGVNAHFQNGVAERKIRELQEHARTMLIHANKRWPSAITTNLWPYALRMANEILNATQNNVTGNIPINAFTGSNIAQNPKHWHTFGCPVYILDNDLQSGKKINKWSDRSKIGINIGHSPQHARTITLVLSLTTGCVSPQFHIKVDNKFETLRTVYGGHPPKSLWQEKCYFVTSQTSTKASPTPTPTTEVTSETGPVPIGPAPDQFIVDQSTVPEEPQTTAAAVNPPEGAPEQQQQREVSNLRKSARTRKRPDRFIETFSSRMEYNPHSGVPYEIFATYIPDDDDYQAYAASRDPDTMYLHEAMKQPDQKQFLIAMRKEVEGQIANGNFEIVHISNVPQGASILPAVWAMRRKRRIETGEVYKWKARLNIDGSKQIKGVNYWDTYAPVASWLVIRLILILVVTQGWKTRQIDYVQAYTQADAEHDLLYMKIPKGFEVSHGDSNDYVLKIKKNIYGQKQAGRVWNQHLVRKLASIGFKQSAIDECVFYRGQCLYVLYTDDSILTGPDDEILDETIKDMKKIGLDITVEDNVSEFLGVKITRHDDGTIEFTQPHLIQQILKDLRLDKENVVTKDIPAASSAPLKRFSNGSPFDKHFDYRSIVGKLNYLEKCTRPDISVAVHQCARFVSDPKIQHGKAITWLGRYLKGTAKQGLRFKPDTTKSVDCYVDADFSGNWDRDEAHHDSDTARSRTGFLITYAGCPLIWASKMQTHIALSSTEAEYIALSTAMREVIPLMGLLKEMKEQGFQVLSTDPKIHCKVFEDNIGAIELATNHKYRPRTKHINTQYHHFRHYVNAKEITIHHIRTEDQLADILTKPLANVLFMKHRMSIMGW